MTSSELPTCPLPQRQGWLRSMAVYLRPRLLLILAQGFASGMPLLLSLNAIDVNQVRHCCRKASSESCSEVSCALFCVCDPHKCLVFAITLSGLARH